MEEWNAQWPKLKCVLGVYFFEILFNAVGILILFAIKYKSAVEIKTPSYNLLKVLGFIHFAFLFLRNTTLFVAFHYLCQKKALSRLETIKRIKLVFLTFDMMCNPPLTLFSKWNMNAVDNEKNKFSSIEGLYIEYCYLAGGITLWALLQ